MNGVTVIQAEQEMLTDQLRSLTFEPIASDWEGKAIAHQLNYLLVVDPSSIHFIFLSSCPPVYDPSLKPGTYIEGLWKQDVVELFLCDDDGPAYQEINIAPSGAWWSKRFSEYRKEDEAEYAKPKSLKCSGLVNEGGWEAAFSVRREELSINCSFQSNSRANVAGIFGKEPRIYFSTCETAHEKPDFHRLEAVGPINLKKMPSTS